MNVYFRQLGPLIKYVGYGSQNKKWAKLFEYLHLFINYINGVDNKQTIFTSVY